MLKLRSRPARFPLFVGLCGPPIVLRLPTAFGGGSKVVLFFSSSSLPSRGVGGTSSIGGSTPRAWIGETGTLSALPGAIVALLLERRKGSNLLPFVVDGSK